METDKMINIFSEEAAARNSTHADMFSQPLTEMKVVLYAILRHIEQYIIGTLWVCKVKSKLTQSITEELLHVCIVVLKFLVIAVLE